MPDIVRHGVTLAEALQEAAASAPVSRAILFAYELWHPTFSAPIRFVNDNVALQATLEADAPRNASTEVEFVACPLALKRPTESDTDASPKVSLERPDVAGILLEAVKAAAGSIEPWQIIERVYASDDTSEPVILPPLSFELVGAQMSAAAAQITAQHDDDANVAIPRITFKREEYPGLQR